MGMLKLAGAISGGGKALQQGLQQTQQYMSQSLLLKEREDMERARMDITYGREVGLMRERQKFDLERDDRQHSRTLDLTRQREEFEMRKGDVERKASREDAATQFERQKERDVTSKVLDASYDQQKEATKSKEARAKEARERADKHAEMEHTTGRDITLKSMELSKPSHAGGASGEASGKWDDTTKHRERALAETIAYYRKKQEFGMPLTDEEKQVLDDAIREHNTMVNLPNKPKPGSVDIGKFDKFRGASPY